jgi:hypothetical protein
MTTTGFLFLFLVFAAMGPAFVMAAPLGGGRGLRSLFWHVRRV